METQTHLQVLQFVNSLSENRVIRIREIDGSTKVAQFKNFSDGRIYFINLAKALKENKVNTNSISISRVKKVKLYNDGRK